jgi:hypothetical protein
LTRFQPRAVMERMAELLVPGTAAEHAAAAVAGAPGGDVAVAAAAAGAGATRRVERVWTLPPCWCLATKQRQGLCVRRARRYHGGAAELPEEEAGANLGPPLNPRWTRAHHDALADGLRAAGGGGRGGRG